MRGCDVLSLNVSIVAFRNRVPKETSHQSSESMVLLYPRTQKAWVRGKVLLVVADLCVDPNGMIFVGDFRVCMFNADGT